MGKHFLVHFANGKQVTIHAESHTDARKQAYKDFPIYEGIEIVVTEKSPESPLLSRRG